MYTQGVSNHGRLHRHVHLLRTIIASKLYGTIERNIEATECRTVWQKLTSGSTDRAAQNVVRTGMGNYYNPVVIFWGGERQL